MEDIRWYPSMANGVLNHYSNEDLLGMKVITAERENGSYTYAVLSSHVHLFHYMMATKPSLRIYNERVAEKQLQKPRFDIDIDSDKELLPGVDTKEELCVYVRDKIVEGILQAIPSADVARNILIYTSHGEEKASCHIIVDGYVHATCHDALGFYELVVPKEIRTYVDASIYDRNHSLRMLWCHKRLSSRVKTFNESFMYKGEVVKYSSGKEFKTDTHRLLHELSCSMITHSVACALLPPYARPKSLYESIPSFDADRCSEVADIMTEKLGSAYAIVGISGNMIRLERKRKDMCVLCSRHHDPNTLPFIIVSNDGTVYWFCGRKDEEGKRRKMTIGRLPPDVSYMEQSARDMCDAMLRSSVSAPSPTTIISCRSEAPRTSDVSHTSAPSYTSVISRTSDTSARGATLYTNSLSRSDYIASKRAAKTRVPKR